MSGRSEDIGESMLNLHDVTHVEPSGPPPRRIPAPIRIFHRRVVDLPTNTVLYLVGNSRSRAKGPTTQPHQSPQDASGDTPNESIRCTRLAAESTSPPT